MLTTETSNQQKWKKIIQTVFLDLLSKLLESEQMYTTVYANNQITAQTLFNMCNDII